MSVYFPIFLLITIAIVFALVMVAVSAILGPKKSTKYKNLPYECGIKDIVGDARERFSVKFYLIAMLFIIFDIEGIFLYIWAITFKDLGLFALIEMAIFIGILFLGYIHIWKKGAFEWE